MKYRLFTLVLALSLIGWTQESPSTSTTPNSTPAPQANSCCHRNTADKAGTSCCHHATPDAAAKESTPSGSEVESKAKNKCEMNDGKPCCDSKTMNAAMKECKKDGCCAKGKGCCEGKSCARSAKASTGCCGGECEPHSAPTVS